MRPSSEFVVISFILSQIKPMFGSEPATAIFMFLLGARLGIHHPEHARKIAYQLEAAAPQFGEQMEIAVRQLTDIIAEASK